MRTVKNYGWFIVIGLAGGLGVPPPARAADPGALSDRIARLATSPRVGGMQVGIRVELLGDKPTLIYQHKSDQPLKPASNQKILTSAAAMTLLPADFTYRTILARRGQDLVIIGAGDPSTGDPRMSKVSKQPITHVFHQWADALKSKGITKITGDLLFDDFVFEQQHVHPGWARQFNLQDWYCAPVGGLNFNDNCVEVLVKPAPRAGEVPEVSLLPPSMYMHLQNTTKTASKGEPRISRSRSDPTTILVSGPVSRGNNPDDAPSIAVPDPGMLFASACRTALAAKGIEIAGETRRLRIRAADLSLPPGLDIIAVDQQKMGEILWRVNKSSLNMFAEALVKTMGAYDGQGNVVAIGSYESGRAAMEKFLDGLDIRADGYVIDDGSGLSHANRITPDAIVAILRHMNAHPRREEWWSNLAVPGESVGTLRRRMKSLAGKVFAKTGSIGGVSALSGYVKASPDRIYAFSILCNDTNKARGMAPHGLQDEICRILADSAPATRSN